ncbi:MAG: alpha/beta fold hydrolase [Lachnospiraceae bacterium]
MDLKWWPGIPNGVAFRGQYPLEESMQNASKDAFNNTLSLANKYTNLYYYHGDEASNWDFYVSCFHVFLSPDYSIMDAIHAYSNPSGDSLFLQVMDIDMSEEQLQIKIPYLILQGEDDLITSAAYNEQLVEENPYMTLKVFENAGHIPTNASFKEMWQAIIEFTNKTEKVEVKYTITLAIFSVLLLAEIILKNIWHKKLNPPQSVPVE